ncbi:tyrosine-type recombinase/integrase [Pediococcus acidilactici]|mgnify:CR=1 FL=1|jgi:integrase|uniref:Tyrosine-type recombinase/integrase n=1 Tax=Pediococcus acidilactici TaxID=1254 RepID=A0AAW8YHY6_PEDAC|nr:tyrosine-type recombinase/integrase [Pediococcus acidilactici]MDV2621192.1 tyrosine-type recombinase/integrase [Pediococcus acidilactici]
MRKWKPLKRHPNIYTYETKRGKRYGVRRVYKDSENKRREFTKSGFRTSKDAEIALTKFESELYEKQTSPIEHSKTTVSEYFGKIAERNLRMEKWRIDTYKTQSKYFQKHIQPRFGTVPLADVTRSDYQHFIDSLVENGYARTTIHTINSIMQMIMNQAETFDLIHKNKLKHIAVMGAQPAKDLTLEDSDYLKWLKTAKDLLDKYQMSMIYLFTLGPRREEILGLRLESFEFSKDKNGQDLCKIVIDRARTSNNPDGGPLKTKSSYRTLYITGDMVNTIKYAIKACRDIREKFNLPITPDTYLYINEASGEKIHPTYPTRLFSKVSKKCGVHIHPHKLRHYFATRAKDSNLSDTSIAKWLGHSNVQMTNKYTRPNKSSVLKVYNGVKEGLGI